MLGLRGNVSQGKKSGGVTQWLLLFLVNIVVVVGPFFSFHPKKMACFEKDCVGLGMHDYLWHEKSLRQLITGVIYIWDIFYKTFFMRPWKLKRINVFILQNQFFKSFPPFDTIILLYIQDFHWTPWPGKQFWFWIPQITRRHNIACLLHASCMHRTLEPSSQFIDGIVSHIQLISMNLHIALFSFGLFFFHSRVLDSPPPLNSNRIYRFKTIHHFPTFISSIWLVAAWEKVHFIDTFIILASEVAARLWWYAVIAAFAAPPKKTRCSYTHITVAREIGYIYRESATQPNIIPVIMEWKIFGIISSGSWSSLFSPGPVTVASQMKNRHCIGAKTVTLH